MTYQFTDAELDVIGVFDRSTIAPLLAEAERRGAEKGWDEGVAARRMEDGSELPVDDNPYRIAQGQP